MHPLLQTHDLCILPSCVWHVPVHPPLMCMARACTCAQADLEEDLLLSQRALDFLSELPGTPGGTPANGNTPTSTNPTTPLSSQLPSPGPRASGSGGGAAAGQATSPAAATPRDPSLADAAKFVNQRL